MLIPTRAGYVYECAACTQRLTPNEADAHSC
jgi:hypothetical protein